MQDRELFHLKQMTKVLCANQFFKKNSLPLPFPLRLISLGSSYVNLICSSAVKSSVSLCIHSKYRKIRTRKTLNKDTFHAVILLKKILSHYLHLHRNTMTTNQGFLKQKDRNFWNFRRLFLVVVFFLRFIFRTQTMQSWLLKLTGNNSY